MKGENEKPKTTQKRVATDRGDKHDVPPKLSNFDKTLIRALNYNPKNAVAAKKGVTTKKSVTAKKAIEAKEKKSK